MSRDRILDDYDDVELNLGALERAILEQADTIKELKQSIERLNMARRQAELMEVDALERELGMARTAELRKECKQPERSAG